MNFDELAGLLQSSRFLPGGEPVEREALRAVPEVADGLPAVRVDPRGPRVWSGCGDAVRAMAAGLAGQLAVAARVDPGQDAERQISADPLVPALARLVEEGARHSPGAAVVPLLEVVRVAWDAQSDTPLAALHRAADGVSLRRVGVAVQARLAKACALASENVRVPALAWAIARSRLLPLFPRGTLDRDPAWPLLAAILDVPLPLGTVDAVETAARLAVRGIAERRAAGRSTADDATLLLRFLVPTRLDGGAEPAAAALLLDPDGLAALLPALGRFVDERALVGAGVDKARAGRLLTPDGGLAVASVFVELVAALRAWDVTSQLVAAVSPSPFRGLAVPRGDTTRAAVVAVGLGRLRTANGAEAAWDELVRAADAGLAGDGVVAFPDAVDALRFALAVRRRIPSAALGLSWGPVAGGTDGAVTRFSGPPVDAALRWVAASPLPPSAPDDPSGLRQAGGWIAGSGLAVDASAAEAIQDARMRRGLATAADGPPAGDPRVPRSVDLHRAFDLDGDVVALVRIPGVSGGFEVLHLSTAAWRDLLDRDGERAPVPAPAPEAPVYTPSFLATPVPAPPPEAEPEESAGWEMTDADELPEEAPVTLDLAEHTGEVPLPAAQPGFEFDTHLRPPTEEEEAPFSGFFLPGAESRLGASPAAPARPAAPSFDMLVEDEEEETQEWVSPPAPAPASPAAERSAADRPAPPRLADVATSAPVVTTDVFGDDDDPFADPYGDAFPVPEELRDPATPKRGGPVLSGDPFADLAGDPFASPPAAGPASSEFAGDPFSESAPLADPFSFAVPDEAAPGRADSAPSRPEPAASRPDAAPSEPADATEPSAPSGVSRPRAERSMTLDFDFLLKGYACFFEKKEAVFGRPYGTRIVDRHVYPYAGDPDAAYLAFLKDKIREGFVPRADMMGDLPRGVTLMPLDPEKLQRAWQDLS